MKDRVLIGDLHNHKGSEVSISGWIDVRRDHGKLIFLDIRDRSGKVQAVALPNNEGVVGQAEKLRSEWVVTISAKVNERPEKMVNTDEANGDIELEVLKVEVLSEAHELPFDKDSELNLDTLLDYRPLTMRRERERSIFKVQHEISRSYQESLTKQGFLEIESPKLVGGDAEGGAEVFSVEYHNNKKVFLATSPQLYKQISVGGLERVFSVGNVFRGEKHSTSRHLNEYTSLDAEMGFVDDHVEIMYTLTSTLRDICSHLKETSENDFKTLGANIPKIGDNIPSIKLREAQELIKNETNEDCTKDKDLSPQHERWLCKYAKENFDSDFIFITHFPKEKTAFYAYEDKEDLGYTKYFDLLFRGVEIVSGGQRVHNYDELISRINEKGLDPEKFSFYLQAFKYGIPPHGGWGMGLERLTQKFLGLENVKEATLFPRDMNRIDTLLSTNEE